MDVSQFQKDDALMYPNIVSSMSDYADSGGDVAEMEKSLAQSYQGNFHVIDAFGSILRTFGIDFRSMFETFLKDQIKQSFNLTAIDNQFNPSHPPQWMEGLPSDKFWISIISELVIKYPTSKFLLYSFESICQQSPHTIHHIPPCYLSFDSFEKVISAQLSLLTRAMNSQNRNLISSLLDMLTIDDRTIVYVASRLDRNNDVPLLRAIENYLPENTSRRRTFITALMRFENCHDAIIDQFQRNLKIDINIISELFVYRHPSMFLKDFVLRRMVRDIFNNMHDSSYHDFLIVQLLEWTGAKEDAEFVYSGIKCFSKWEFNTPNQKALGLYIAKIKFCAMAMIPVIKNRILTSNLFSPVKDEQSTEQLLLCEIAFWHPDFISEIFDIVKEGIWNCTKRRDLDDQSSTLRQIIIEFYKIALFLFNLGYYKGVLVLFQTEFSKNISDISQKPKREALITMMETVKAPYSRDFISCMAKCLSNPMISKLFFTAQGREILPSEVKYLKVLDQFISKIFKDGQSNVGHEERAIYDKLQTKTKKQIAIGLGRPQLKLDQFSSC